jgi:hypothetical protein
MQNHNTWKDSLQTDKKINQDLKKLLKSYKLRQKDWHNRHKNQNLTYIIKTIKSPIYKVKYNTNISPFILDLYLFLFPFSQPHLWLLFLLIYNNLLLLRILNLNFSLFIPTINNQIRFNLLLISYNLFLFIQITSLGLKHRLMIFYLTNSNPLILASTTSILTVRFSILTLFVIN